MYTHVNKRIIIKKTKQTNKTPPKNRPNTNAAILWKPGHTKGMSHMRGIGQKKETKKMNVVDVLFIQ
jgi:hypothetical protein